MVSDIGVIDLLQGKNNNLKQVILITKAYDLQSSVNI